MRTMRVARIALLSAVLIVTVALATSVSASAATVIHFQPESLSVLEVQLGKHEVHAVTFHPTSASGHIHVSMNDGRHFTVVYTTGEQAQLVALAHASGARYTVATVKPKKAAAPVHHTLRYVAGGIVIVVIIVVAAVLLVDRRRKLNEDGRETSPTPGDSTT